VVSFAGYFTRRVIEIILIDIREYEAAALATIAAVTLGVRLYRYRIRKE